MTEDPDMKDLFAPIRNAIAIEVPQAHKRPIAIVGAGAITDIAHLPAYRAHGLEVVGITDIDADRAKDVARRHGIPRVYASSEEIARDPDVPLVDIAVFPWVQYEVATPLLDAGKDLLLQKPISYDYDEARRLVA
jgi:predicted dehydrogenase